MGRLFPGADLHGATERLSYWGGQENDLLRSVNDCRVFFQGARELLSADQPEAADLYAFLASLEGPSDAVPFTVVRSVEDLPAGDAQHGGAVYSTACQSCHGGMASGQGAAPGIPILPDDTLVEHGQYSVEEQRMIFIEKARHGGFLGYGGSMPPFSTEVLSDADLSDLLSALELYP